jgi:hypothetical protein
MRLPVSLIAGSRFSIMNISQFRSQNRKGFNRYGRDLQYAEHDCTKKSKNQSHYHVPIAAVCSFTNGGKSIAGSLYPSLRLFAIDVTVYRLPLKICCYYSAVARSSSFAYISCNLN